MKIKKEFIQVKDSVKDWKEAIIIASKPLLEEKIITENYQNKMIENVKTMGPYIVLSNDIALPHARPEDGAIMSALSILKLKNRVNFSDEKDVNVIIALACSNDDDHIKTLKYISEKLSNKETYADLIKTNDVNKIFNILS
ncbi:MAG: PTS sugar transporter subunit IIA [Peptoniphilaceae bacterium]|nr:PTS sugar transporter subunit IIA [Peptoniphilaceae bacterium]MDY6018981.1 PTS sugar transporter subunit IIA [Anaerococcus sp.]